MRVRRRIGLAAFFYALLHISVYLALDLELSLAALWEDVVERKFITFGMMAFALLVPLAITSHDVMIKKLGALRWRRLHWAVYPIGVLAVVHHYFAEKGDQPGPWVHGAILAALLGWRIAKRFKLVSPRTSGSRQQPASKPTAS
jgi:sulfoxide reductase heme-binding subunit YedZ